MKFCKGQQPIKLPGSFYQANSPKLSANFGPKIEFWGRLHLFRIFLRLTEIQSLDRINQIYRIKKAKSLVNHASPVQLSNSGG